MDDGLRRRVALITGCTSPLGATIARMLGAQGAWIALNYFADNLAAKSLLDVIRAEGGRSMLGAGSVRDAEGAWKVARYIESEWAQIDILIHVAPLHIGAEFAHSPQPLLGELLPGMNERHWGRVVIFNAGSDDALINAPVSPNVLINTVQVVNSPQDEALARLTLFLASEWNMCLNKQTLSC